MIIKTQCTLFCMSQITKGRTGEEGGGQVMRADEEDIKRGGEKRKKTNSEGPGPGTHKPVRSTGFMV